MSAWLIVCLIAAAFILGFYLGARAACAFIGHHWTVIEKTPMRVPGSVDREGAGAS